MKTNNCIFILINLIIIFSIAQCSSNENKSLFKQAKSLEKAGLLDEADNIYYKLLKNEPSNFQYYSSYKRLLKRIDLPDKLIDIAYNYYQSNKENPSAYYEWISALIAGQNKNWKLELELFVENQYSNKNLMRQILYSMYSSGVSQEIKPIIEKMRLLTKNNSFLSRELGDIYILRMDYGSSVSELLLFLEANPNDFKYVSEKIMATPQEKYITDIIRNILENNKSDMSKRILSNLEFREKNYELAWNILKKQPDSIELQIDMINDLIENQKYNFSEKVSRDIISKTKDKKIIEKCIFNIGKALELKSIHNTNRLPISGFFRSNSFFKSPFLSVNLEDNSLVNAISIFDSLSQNSNDKNNAKLRLGDIKFRVLGDLDGAKEIYTNILKYSKHNNIKKNCTLRLVEIDIAKGDLLSATKRINDNMNLFKKNDEKINLKMKFAQILMFEGARDSLNSYLRDSMKYLKSTDESFNDILDILSLNLTFEKDNKLYSNFGKAQFLIQQNKRQEAIYLLEEMNNIDSPLLYELVQYQIINLYLMQKEYQTAIELAISLNGETIYSELAFILQCEIADYINKDYRLAADLYLEFLNNYPDSIYYDTIRLRLRELAS